MLSKQWEMRLAILPPILKCRWMRAPPSPRVLPRLEEDLESVYGARGKAVPTENLMPTEWSEIFFPSARRFILLTFCIREHVVAAHRRCPKMGCGWDEARDGKELQRHVWYNHKLWAETTEYPRMAAQCDECGEEFARGDGLGRHKREVHGKIKRDRRLKG